MVNPWDADEIGEGLHTALIMSPEDRRAKHDLLYKYPL